MQNRNWILGCLKPPFPRRWESPIKTRCLNSKIPACAGMGAVNQTSGRHFPQLPVFFNAVASYCRWLQPTEFSVGSGCWLPARLGQSGRKPKSRYWLIFRRLKPTAIIFHKKIINRSPLLPRDCITWIIKSDKNHVPPRNLFATLYILNTTPIISAIWNAHREQNPKHPGSDKVAPSGTAKQARL